MNVERKVHVFSVKKSCYLVTHVILASYADGLRDERFRDEPEWLLMSGICFEYYLFISHYSMIDILSTIIDKSFKDILIHDANPL